MQQEPHPFDRWFASLSEGEFALLMVGALVFVVLVIRWIGRQVTRGDR